MVKIIIAVAIFILNTTTIVDAASLFKDRLVEYREEGRQAQKKSDFDKAQEFYQKVIQVDPYHAVTYNDLGVVYEAKGQLKPAEDAYLKAIELAPDFVAPYYNLGCLYEKVSHYSKAVEYLNKRIDLGDPSDIWTQKAKDQLARIQSIVNPSSQGLIKKEPSADTVSIKEIKEEVSKTKDTLEEIREEVSKTKDTLEEIKEEIAWEIVKKTAVVDDSDILKEELKEEAEAPIPPVATPLCEQRETQDQHLQRARSAYEEKDYLTAELEAAKALQLDPYSKEAEELLRRSHRKFLVD